MAHMNTLLLFFAACVAAQNASLVRTSVSSYGGSVTNSTVMVEFHVEIL